MTESSRLFFKQMGVYRCITTLLEPVVFAGVTRGNSVDLVVVNTRNEMRRWVLRVVLLNRHEKRI